jgi:hypothetical protein
VPSVPLWSAAFGLLALAAAGKGIEPERHDFEKDEAGKPPSGWLLTTPGFEAVVARDQPRRGRQCVRVRAMGEGAKERVGVLLRSIDATPDRGRRVRLRGALRIEPAGREDRIQLWLRVDREGDKVGFFDNMDDRPIRRRDWSEAEVVGEVAPDAKAIVYGLLVFGSSPAWADDLSLEDAGATPEKAKESARPLAVRGLENLVAFTRLLGYVRHFHPSDAAADADWDDVAVAGVRAIEPATSPQDLARRLEEVFQPLGPTVLVFPAGAEPQLPAPLTVTDRAKAVVAWEHHGYGGGSMPAQMSVYRSQRRRRWALDDGKRPEGAPDPSLPFRADLGGGVSCLVPLAVYADDKGTIPHVSASEANGKSKPKSAPAPYSGDDRATRLAAVALGWNVLRHFYPYFDVVQTDWPAPLREALQSAATDRDEQVFLATLRRMVAALHDGHGGVYLAGGGGNPAGCPPLAWDWVEGKLVVTAVPGADAPAGLKSDLKPGEVVGKIDGRPAAEALADAERLISAATPQWRRYRALQQLGAGDPGSALVLEVGGQGSVARTVRLGRALLDQRPREARPPRIKELRSGIFYVDLDRIDDSDFTKALPDLERATGIVFDLRGYPAKLSPQVLFQHLIDKVCTSPQWHIPLVRRPDGEGVEFKRSPGWILFPAKPRLNAKIAFVTDGRDISYAESCLGIIENYRLGAIVGGPTAGTNGNVNPFALPGGYRVVWTGMKVLKHDGSRHHGVGIAPTVPVSRTIAGVAAGRDELLEKAIEVVEGNKS